MGVSFPQGQLLSQALNIKAIKPRQKIEELLGKGFSGYLVLTIEGFDGLEEGVIILRNGSVVGAVYEYSKYGVVVEGPPALQQFFNALGAAVGVMDVVALSQQQTELVMAFHEKMALSRPHAKKDLISFYTQEYSPYFAQNILSTIVKRVESKHEVFKKLGLHELG
ncbi:MAG: DUF2226 domain-containing protein [Candidatus Diapherotrites archaeon]